MRSKKPFSSKTKIGGILLKVQQDLEKIVDNAYKQGKTHEQVKQMIKVYLKESKRKVNLYYYIN